MGLLKALRRGKRARLKQLAKQRQGERSFLTSKVSLHGPGKTPRTTYLHRRVPIHVKTGAARSRYLKSV